MTGRSQQSHASYWLVLTGLAIMAAAAFAIMLSKTSSSDAGDWQQQWRLTTSFAIPRRALAAAVAPAPRRESGTANGSATAYLYVIGGVDDAERYVRDVEVAPISPDGSLGSWRTTSPLREDRFYLAAAVLNNHIYALGGGQGSLGSDNLPVASVERAEILPNGDLGAWETAGYMTTPRRGLKTVTHDNIIYAIGGYNGTFLKTTERAGLLPDGTLGPWQLDPEASVIDRYIHSATILNNVVYLLGGHVQGGRTMSYGDVESSRFRDDGSLTPWQVENTILQTPRFIASSFALNGFVYILGGHDGAQRLRSVEFAATDTAGHVGSWTATANLQSPRSATALAVYDDTVYVLGGMGESGALNSVEMARQNRHGRLGHPARK